MADEKCGLAPGHRRYEQAGFEVEWGVGVDDCERRGSPRSDEVRRQVGAHRHADILSPSGFDHLANLLVSRVEAVVEPLRHHIGTVVVHIEIDQATALFRVIEMLDVDVVVSEEPENLGDPGLTHLEVPCQGNLVDGLGMYRQTAYELRGRRTPSSHPGLRLHHRHAPSISVLPTTCKNTYTHRLTSTTSGTWSVEDLRGTSVWWLEVLSCPPGAEH